MTSLSLVFQSTPSQVLFSINKNPHLSTHCQPFTKQNHNLSTMSTDLDFLHGSSKSRLLTVKTRTSSTPQASNNIGGNNNNNNIGVVAQKINEDENDVEYNCRTPTSKEHRVPSILDCPPAPRKPKRAPSCKRKLSEVQFFEIVNYDEVDAFFRSSFDKLAVLTSVKRNCCPCK